MDISNSHYQGLLVNYSVFCYFTGEWRNWSLYRKRMLRMNHPPQARLWQPWPLAQTSHWQVLMITHLGLCIQWPLYTLAINQVPMNYPWTEQIVGFAPSFRLKMGICNLTPLLIFTDLFSDQLSWEPLNIGQSRLYRHNICSRLVRTFWTCCLLTMSMTRSCRSFCDWPHCSEALAEQQSARLYYAVKIICSNPSILDG